MFDLNYLKLSFQRGALGEISPSLRAVTLGFQEKLIKGIFYFQGEVSEDNIESVSCIEGEVIADFSEDYTIDFRIERLDYPGEMKMLDAWVYRRKEF
jgi:hypothetical protein